VLGGEYLESNGTSHWYDGNLGGKHWSGRGISVSEGEADNDDYSRQRINAVKFAPPLERVVGAAVCGRALRSSRGNVGLQWMVILTIMFFRFKLR
jgi:hypothetical protein